MVLADLQSRIRAILADQFTGMYLYGSLARGGFEPSRSDFDFVVITQDHLPAGMIKQLESMHMALAEKGSKWHKKLEGAYVPQAIIRKHSPQHPPVPTLNEGSFYMSPLGSDWVMQRYILRESDGIISGPSLRDQIDAVTPDDLRVAVLEIIDHWWEPMLANQSRLRDTGYQPFAVLSMCRSLYTVQNGELASKTKSAKWALDNLPAGYAPLIIHALQWQDGDQIESIEQTAAFMRFVIARCRTSE